MRPKSRKSIEQDAASSKRLSTNMKPQSKSRSNESLGKSTDASGKRSPLALLNTTRSVRLRRAPGSQESLKDTSPSQGRLTRQRAKAKLFAGTSQVKLINNMMTSSFVEYSFSYLRLHWWTSWGIFCQTRFLSSLMEVL